jgi:hypothetical protein
MRIQTILNRVEKFKSFIHGEARLEEHDDGPALVIQVEPRKNGRPFCSGCGRRARPYDRLEERRFEFVPIWGILVFWAYRMRRVDCKRCGVTVEMVPWVCDGYEPVLKRSRWCFLKRPQNLTDKQTVRLSEILKYNLSSGFAHFAGIERVYADALFGRVATGSVPEMTPERESRVATIDVGFLARFWHPVWAIQSK